MGANETEPRWVGRMSVEAPRVGPDSSIRHGPKWSPPDRMTDPWEDPGAPTKGRLIGCGQVGLELANNPFGDLTEFQVFVL